MLRSSKYIVSCSKKEVLIHDTDDLILDKSKTFFDILEEVIEKEKTTV